MSEIRPALAALRGKNTSGRLPVWLMRQAGRYHSHYQDLRKRHSFRELCLVPPLACETTMGPVRDFGMDAAILFSDILFAVEACGVGVEYPAQGPQLDFLLRTPEDIKKLKAPEEGYFKFQKDACQLLRKVLPKDTSLIGFAGAPWTLFVFLADGTHKGAHDRSVGLLKGGSFEAIAPLLEDAVVQSLRYQWEGGAEILQIFDSAAGTIDAETWQRYVLPSHLRVMSRVAEFCPDIVYFPKGTTPEWTFLRELPWQCLSVDWAWNLKDAHAFAGSRSVQGNFHPEHLMLPSEKLETHVRSHFEEHAGMSNLIANLGHGVLPGTPEENVRLFVRTVQGLGRA